MKLFNNLLFLMCLFLLSCSNNEEPIPTTPNEPSIIHVAQQENLFNNPQDTIIGDCIEGDCENGRGKYVTKDGFRYEGEFKSGKAEGNGRFDMPGGFYKEGIWKNGRLVNGKEYNAFDSTLYNGGFVMLDIDDFKIDVPHGLGTMQFGYNTEKIRVEHDSGEVVSMGNIDYRTYYTKRVRKPCLPVDRSNLRKKPDFNAQYQRINRLPDFSKVRLFGRPTRHGVTSLNRKEATYGRMIRALRFQNITQAVEKHYGLPDNIILAMIMIESSGIMYLPNGSDDGGIGLAHMQGIVAEEFGMRTVCDKNCGIRCFSHGRYLRQQIHQKEFQDAALFPVDDRFQPILNLDAVGRMLALYQRKARTPRINPPIKQGIYYYAGRHNFRNYWRHVKFYMSKLNNPKTIRNLEKAFNRRNNRSGITYEQYLSAFHQMNYNYGLEEYTGLCNKKPVKPTPNPDLIPPKDDLNTPCYVVVVFATADQLRATSIVEEFRTKGYPLADYIWLPDYPNNYRPYPAPELYQVYLRVSKSKIQIEQLEREIKRDLPQFSDVFVKQIR